MFACIYINKLPLSYANMTVSLAYIQIKARILYFCRQKYAIPFIWNSFFSFVRHVDRKTWHLFLSLEVTTSHGRGGGGKTTLKRDIIPQQPPRGISI